ncbi:MAG: GNAT family N-acetyltransferase [Candidatus Hydrogenedentota bacterium]|nr:MAG: GNAT family N-acetyltransferase [Candidatus Hydrogenedentota bacterium]
MSTFDPKPIVLEGQTVNLIPMLPEHAEALMQVGNHPSIWQYLPVKYPETLEDYQAFIVEAKQREQDLGDVAFVVYHKEEDRIVGTTRYLDVQKHHRGLEIGWTWLGTDYWRTVVNTECKFLLFSHAFDDLGAIRVQLKTDSRNNRSQKAIERIGAKREGTLRNHYIMPDGYQRSTVMFSITQKDWKEVKPQLKLRLL